LIPLAPALNYGERGIPNELGMTPAMMPLGTSGLETDHDDCHHRQ
jgi:hypothetical protein